MSQPRIAMIAALADNRVIGRDNALPWHISADLKHFKRTTLGKPIIMGRKTYESIGRPLPGRRNIVVSRRTDFRPDGVSVAGSAEEAVTLARAVAIEEGVSEVMVIGGEQLYRSLLPLAQRLYLTEVHCVIEGDAWFPPLDASWREVERQSEREGDWHFSFVTLDRVPALE